MSDVVNSVNVSSNFQEGNIDQKQSVEPEFRTQKTAGQMAMLSPYGSNEDFP